MVKKTLWERKNVFLQGLHLQKYFNTKSSLLDLAFGWKVPTEGGCMGAAGPQRLQRPGGRCFHSVVPLSNTGHLLFSRQLRCIREQKRPGSLPLRCGRPKAQIPEVLSNVCFSQLGPFKPGSRFKRLLLASMDAHRRPSFPGSYGCRIQYNFSA